MIRGIFDNILFIVAIIAILTLSTLLIDCIASKPEAFHGNVIDKHYKAESTSVSTGTIVGSNGGVGVATTTDYEPEGFLIMVEIESGIIVTVKCEPELYYQKEVGERIECNAYRGFIY